MKSAMETATAGAAPDRSDRQIGTTELNPTHRIDLRQYSEQEYNKFVKLNTVKDWSQLTWQGVGKPYEVNTLSKDRRAWEREHGRSMDPKTSWSYFNKAFQEWFDKDVPGEIAGKKAAFIRSLASFRPGEICTALGDVARIRLWNYVHRIQDGVWDPRGKRALFEGLNLRKPRILFLGAAEGYEAMQLAAMYPGAQVVMVDYDAYCETDRYGKFPESYPFLGENPATGGTKIYYKNDFDVTYVVDDIRSLDYGQEFDLVVSVGLIEHFPDSHKAEAIDWHRKFLKPGGYAILTTPRNQWKSRLFYRVMADVMNHTHRELMTLEQMGLYIYENGFNIVRHGYLKVHNCIIAQPR